MPPTYKGATDSEFRHFERLIAEGHTPYVASRMAGTTLRRLGTGAGDPKRFKEIMERSREVRAAVVDERMDELVKAETPSPAIVTAWAKANHEGYRQGDRVEVTGDGGGPVRHEHKVVSASAVLHVLREAGALEDDRLGDALPTASNVLAAHAGEES